MLERLRDILPNLPLGDTVVYRGISQGPDFAFALDVFHVDPPVLSLYTQHGRDQLRRPGPMNGGWSHYPSYDA